MTSNNMLAQPMVENTCIKNAPLMCEVQRGTDVQKTLQKFMVMSGTRKELEDQGTSEYLQSYIKDESIYRPYPMYTYSNYE
jgi:hypothetical protein